MRVDEAYDGLARAFREERLAQAYVISAPPRNEGSMLAERLLMLLFCGEKEGPCGVCAACRHARERTHADVLWLEPQRKSRQILIEQVRDLQKRVFQTSLAGGWKVCVLCGADRLGVNAANAFLKTLEEPPERTLFLLLTDSPQFLLPTIISRCQTVSLALSEIGSDDPWAEQVRELVPGDDVAGTLGAMASTERMVRLLASLKAAARDAETAAAEEGALDEEDATVEARAAARYREARSALLRSLLLWYRDILVLAGGGDETLVHHRAAREELRRQAMGGDVLRALKHIQIIEDASRQMERNLPEAAVLSVAFARLQAGMPRHA